MKRYEPKISVPVSQRDSAKHDGRGRDVKPESEDREDSPAERSSGQIYSWNERVEEPAEGLLSASGLFETAVRDVNGRRLGEIEDFVLDLVEGEIRYVVFSFGGVFGLGSKLCAVAPNLLELDEKNKCFRLSYDKKRVGDAPEFDRYEWRRSPWTTHGGSIYILRNRKRRGKAEKIRSDHYEAPRHANVVEPKIAPSGPG